MIGIYKITSPTGKIYIGQSVDIVRRKNDHKICIDKGILQNSIKKHGFENHIFEIIEECEISLLNERERYWQDFYDVLGLNGLNLRLTRVNDKSGHISEKQKEQISNANKGRLRTDKQKEATSKFFTGRKLTEEHKEKIRLNGRKGPHSKETKKKISIIKNTIDPTTGLTSSQLAGIKITATNKGRVVSEEMKQRISNTLKGRKVPAETIAKRIETYRLRREQN